MPTELRPEQEPLAQRLLDMASSIEALNVRIARLAIGLGVSLDSEVEVARAMSQTLAVSAVSHERRTAPGPSAASHTGPDRRMAHKREELRGLLVLRYGVETRYVDEVGVVATRQILVEAEAHLVRDGFKPGADGIDLDRLFKAS